MNEQDNFYLSVMGEEQGRTRMQLKQMLASGQIGRVTRWAGGRRKDRNGSDRSDTGVG